MPTLVVWEEEDEWLPVDTARRLTGAIPDAKLRVIEGAGHLIQEDRSVELTEVIRGWLAELDE